MRAYQRYPTAKKALKLLNSGELKEADCKQWIKDRLNEWDEDHPEDNVPKVLYKLNGSRMRPQVGIRQTTFPSRQIANITGPPKFRYRKLESLMDKPRPSL